MRKKMFLIVAIFSAFFFVSCSADDLEVTVPSVEASGGSGGQMGDIKPPPPPIVED